MATPIELLAPEEAIALLKRRRRRRLIVLGSTVVVLIAVASYFIVLWQSGPQPSELQGDLAKALAYQDSGDERAAVIELKNILQRNPGNRDARRALGALQLRAGQYDDAANQFSRLDPEGTTDLELQQQWLSARLGTGDHHGVMAWLVLKASSVPLTVAEQFLLAQARLAAGDIERARATLLDAKRQDPAHLGVALELARLDFREQPDSAKAALERILKQTEPHEQLHFGALMLKGEFALSEGDNSSAITAFENASGIYALHPASKLGQARALIALKRFDDADAVLDTVERSAQQHASVSFLRAIIAQARDDVPAARTALERALAQSPEHAAALLMLGRINHEDKRPQQARDLLTRYLALKPQDFEARKLLANVLLEIGQPNPALQALGTVSKERANDAVLLDLLGRIALAKDDYVRAMTYLERAVMIAPTEPTISARLALAQLQAGQHEKAQASLIRARKNHGKTHEAHLLSYLVAMQSNDLELAERVTNELIAARPEHALAYALRGLAKNRQSPGASDAESDLNKALELDPRSAIARVGLAEVALERGDDDSAHQQLTDVVMDSNAEPAVRMRASHLLGRLEYERGNLVAARKHLDQAVNMGANDAPVMNLIASIAHSSGDWNTTVDYLKRAWSSDQRDMRAGKRLLASYLSAQLWPEARRVARELLVEVPGDDNTALVLAEVELRSGDASAALKTLEGIRIDQIDPAIFYQIRGLSFLATKQLPQAREDLSKAQELGQSSTTTLVALGSVHLADGNLREANDILDELQRMAPSERQVILFRGDVQRASNNVVAARASYEEAAKQRTDVDVARRMLLTYPNAERVTEGIAKLKQWLQQADNEVKLPLAHYVARVAIDLQQLPVAAFAFERALEIDPKQVRVLNDLAWIYGELGEVERGLKLAQRAYDGAPDDAQVLDTYGWLLSLNEQHERAVRMLKVAAERSPGQHGPRLRMALALARLGDVPGAKKAIEIINPALLLRSERELYEDYVSGADPARQ